MPRLLRALVASALCVLTSCATLGDDIAPQTATASRAEIVFIPRAPERPQVQVSPEQFQEAMRWLLPQMAQQAGLQPPQTPSVVLASWERPDVAMREMIRDYQRWCHARGEPEDCLELLPGGQTNLGPDARRSLALRLSLAPTMDSMRDALREAGSNPAQLLGMLTFSIASYLVLMALPEPTSKLIAAAATVYLTAYLGADTLISLVKAYLRLRDEAEEASSFGELREASEHFAQVLGPNGARVLIMAFTAVLGHTTNLLIGRLPGAGQASALIKVESGGFGLAALVERVQAAAVTVRDVTLVLAPVAVIASPVHAVAMAANNSSNAHHIATNKNSEATWNGGPWTPKFQKIFNKAGMSLENSENIINVKGHQGPHPDEYHQEVFNRLTEAVEDCDDIASCRAELTKALRRLAQEISTPGTRLNELVTKQ